jgi:hypothetical protein
LPDCRIAGSGSLATLLLHAGFDPTRFAMADRIVLLFVGTVVAAATVLLVRNVSRTDD